MKPGARMASAMEALEEMEANWAEGRRAPADAVVQGVPDAQRVVDRARSTGGQFEWVGKAQAGSNAVGTFAKVQPRYTHAQASEIMALMKK